MEEKQITLDNLEKGADNPAFSSLVSPPFPRVGLQELLSVLLLTVFSRGRRDSMRNVMVHVARARRRGEEKGDCPPTAGRTAPGDVCVYVGYFQR